MAIAFVDILKAANHSYDNTQSGLTASDVKSAIDEVSAAGGGNVSTPDAAGEGSINTTHMVGMTETEYANSSKVAGTVYFTVPDV